MATSTDKHRILEKIINTMKIYFETDSDISVYYIYSNMFKKIIDLNNPNRNIVDIYIKNENLYFSFTENNDTIPIEQELCRSRDIQLYKQGICNYKNLPGITWYDDYNTYLNNCRHIKHEEIISELLTNLRQLQQEVDYLKKELKNYNDESSYVNIANDDQTI